MSLDFIKGQLPQTSEEVPKYLVELTLRLEEAFTAIDVADALAAAAPHPHPLPHPADGFLLMGG